MAVNVVKARHLYYFDVWYDPAHLSDSVDRYISSFVDPNIIDPFARFSIFYSRYFFCISDTCSASLFFNTQIIFSIYIVIYSKRECVEFLIKLVGLRNKLHISLVIWQMCTIHWVDSAWIKIKTGWIVNELNFNNNKKSWFRLSPTSCVRDNVPDRCTFDINYSNVTLSRSFTYWNMRSFGLQWKLLIFKFFTL